MRFSKVAVAVSVCALAALGGGCSSSSDDGSTPVTLDQYPQAYANALCDTVAPCCKAANVPYVESGCKSTATDQWVQVVAVLSAGHTHYDANAAGRCIAALKNEAVGCVEKDDGAGAVCNTVFTGTIALGGACTTSNDCVSGDCQFDTTVDPTTGGFNQTGVCAAVPANAVTHARTGEPCSGTCDDSSASSCHNFGPGNGGFCYVSDGLFCSFDTEVCTKVGKIGEPCSPGACVTGAYCDAGTCAAQIDSGSCAQAEDACSAKSYCDLGQCFAKKQDHFGCMTSAECVSGVCSLSATAAGSQRTCGAQSLATPQICSGASLNP